MFRRGILNYFSAFVRNVCVVTSATTCLSASLVTAAKEEEETSTPITANRILASQHRIALAEWPVSHSKPDDDRVNTLDRLIDHLRNCGYDGIEMALQHFEHLYFKDSELSTMERIAFINDKFDAADLGIFGILLHSRDEDWEEHSVDLYLSKLQESLRLNKLLGAEYVTFQIWLPERYMMGDGSYRNDTQLLEDYVSRIEILQKICFAEGLNFYVETHVGRISEDPEAFVKVMDMSKTHFELNGDLSHYICRGMMKGPFVDRIIREMQHTHVRMARVYGDLSVNVEDPVNDWNDPDGVTQTYWKFTRKGFENGLSSRVIVGESGPMHLVDDPLGQDQRMVPLLRAMARYCDEQIVQSDLDSAAFNPFISREKDVRERNL